MTMKRLLAVILTSCMIARLVSPAGAGVMTEIRANTEAALNNLSASNERTEVAAEGADNFDQTIRDLYDNSMSVTDEEIIASAQMMNSDFEAVESEMGEDATAVIDYLKYYEAAKTFKEANPDKYWMSVESSDIWHMWPQLAELGGDMTDAELAAKRDGRLRHLARQRLEPAALSACKQHCEALFLAHTDSPLSASG